jgi:hypothetical protein
VEHGHGCSRPDLFRRRQQSVCIPRADRNTDAYTYCDCNFNTDSYSNRYSYCNPYRECYPNGHRYCHANVYPIRHRNSDSDGNSHSYHFRQSDTVTQTNPHSEIPCDTKTAAKSAAETGRKVSGSSKRSSGPSSRSSRCKANRRALAIADFLFLPGL